MHARLANKKQERSSTDLIKQTTPRIIYPTQNISFPHSQIQFAYGSNEIHKLGKLMKHAYWRGAGEDLAWSDERIKQTI